VIAPVGASFLQANLRNVPAAESTAGSFQCGKPNRSVVSHFPPSTSHYPPTRSLITPKRVLPTHPNPCAGRSFPSLHLPLAWYPPPRTGVSAPGVLPRIQSAQFIRKPAADDLRDSPSPRVHNLPPKIRPRPPGLPRESAGASFHVIISSPTPKQKRGGETNRWPAPPITSQGNPVRSFDRRPKVTSHQSVPPLSVVEPNFFEILPNHPTAGRACRRRPARK